MVKNETRKLASDDMVGLSYQLWITHRHTSCSVWKIKALTYLRPSLAAVLLIVDCDPSRTDSIYASVPQFHRPFGVWVSISPSRGTEKATVISSLKGTHRHPVFRKELYFFRYQLAVSTMVNLIEITYDYRMVMKKELGTLQLYRSWPAFQL